MKDLILRQEEAKDHPFVFDLIQEAFREMDHSDQTEHLLVERLRISKAFIPELSLVAECNGEIAGHILFSRIWIVSESKNVESLALAPVSVIPDFQGIGIGSQLIQKGHQIARDLGFRSVVVVGDPGYYSRFGYQPASKFGIQFPFEIPEHYCMATELTKNGLSGVSGLVRYAKEFLE
jgi:predicted N-acetyltransferase YhbS